MKKLVALLLITWLLVPLIALGAVENFSDYTEVDPGSDLTVISTKIDAVSVLATSNDYVYKDMGAAYFNGDFTHHVEVYIGASRDGGYGENPWGLKNDTNGFPYTGTAVSVNVDTLHVFAPDEGGDARVFLCESDASTALSYCDWDSVGTTPELVYLKIVRDESVGTFGTIYSYAYSDAARTTLTATQSVALHTSKKDFRYVYPFANRYESSGTNYFSSYTGELDLAPAGPTASYRGDGGYQGEEE